MASYAVREAPVGGSLLYAGIIQHTTRAHHSPSVPI